MADSAAIMPNDTGLTPVPKKAWGYMLLVLFMSIAAPLNMFKAPGLAGTLMGFFKLDPGSFGWLMSIFTVMGIVLAFPAAGIMAKIGIKRTCAIGLVSLIIGSIVGAFASSYTVLLAGRFLEGVSMGLITVAAPAAISMWFPLHRRGLALGIWAPWVPIGNVVMLNIANPIASSFGGSWQSVWWFGTIYAVAMLILWLVFYKQPDTPILDLGEENLAATKKSSDGNAAGKSPFLVPSIWLIAISFCIFNILQNGSINTFYTTYLMEAHSFAQPDAASITSIITLLAIPGCWFAGWIADVLKTRKWVIVAGYASIAIAAIWLFSFDASWQMWVAVAVCGFFAPLAVTNIWAASSEIMGPAYAGIGMAITTFMMNIGQFIGGLALGNIQVSLGWSMGSYVLFFPLIAVAIICLVCTGKKLR